MSNTDSFVDRSFFVLADALLTPVLRGVGRAAVAAARAVHRAVCIRNETRVASALGMPTPESVRAVWTPPRRSLRQALLIGSKLVDLGATHPSTRRRAPADETGKCRFLGREGGLKQYFADNLPDLPYPTAMRYRRLALRVLRVLETPAALPLEWMLCYAPADNLTDNPTLADALREGRRKLAELLADIRSQRELTRVLDRRLDSDRLPLSRNAALDEQAAAVCEEIRRRGEEKLAAAVAEGRPLTASEKRALALLKRVRKLERLFEKRK